MTKIQVGFITDTHAEPGRWAEHCRILSWCADDMERRGVTLMCHGGDHYHAGSKPEERTWMNAWVQRIGSFASQVHVAGNHGHREDVAAFGALRTEHPIVASTEPGMHILAGVAVGTLPWPRPAHLVAALGRPTPIEQVNAVAREVFKDIARGLGVQMGDFNGARVLLGHVMIEGSKPEVGQPLWHDVLGVGVGDLMLANADVNLIGHIHAPQHWTVGSTPTIYGGSPYRRDFGEPGGKGYVLVTFEDSFLVGWERIATPARPMHLLVASWHDGKMVLDMPPPDQMADADVRLRYAVPADQRVAAAMAADDFMRQMYAHGAAQVKPEPQVVTTTVARAAGVAEATSFGEQLKATWTWRGKLPDDARMKRLEPKVAELEAVL